jgi:hypothetical protein
MLFLAAAGWSVTPLLTAEELAAAISSACVGLGVVVWLAGRWVREPRRFTPEELAPAWEA